MQITYSYTSVICNLYQVNYFYKCSYLRADEILYPCRERAHIKQRTLLVLLTVKALVKESLLKLEYIITNYRMSVSRIDKRDGVRLH